MADPIFLKQSCPHCGGHVEYSADDAGRAIPCPHCQSPWILPAAPKPKMPAQTLRVMIAGGLVLVGLVGVAGVRRFRMGPGESAVRPRNEPSSQPSTAGRSAEKPPSAPSPKRPKSAEDLKCGATKLEEKPGSSLVYLVGTVSNNSDHQRFGVKIELDLFDPQGQKVGIATDYTPVIEPRERWSFRALVNEAKVISAKVARISEQD